MKKRIILLLCLCAVLLAAIVGCAKSNSEPTQTVEPTPVETSSGSEPEETFDYVSIIQTARKSYSADAVVMTVNGRELTWDAYFYWLADQLSLYCSYVGSFPPWEEELEPGLSYDQYFRDYADKTLVYLLTLEDKAAQLGVDLSDESQQLMDAAWTGMISSIGSEEEALAYLDSYFLTKENYEWINRVNLLYSDVFLHLYGDKAADFPDADTLAYAEDQGYMHAKHILFLTTDDAGAALPEDEKAAVLTLATDTLAQLQGLSGDALESAFDTLMAEKSEDSGLLYYPDGYTFLYEEMVEPFSAAAEALGDGEMSDLVESPYGYHIILRLPLDPDAITEYDSSTNAPLTLRYAAAYADYQTRIDSWIEEVDIEFSDDFKDLTISSLFD